jgi:hypothetical protein
MRDLASDTIIRPNKVDFYDFALARAPLGGDSDWFVKLSRFKVARRE